MEEGRAKEKEMARQTSERERKCGEGEEGGERDREIKGETREGGKRIQGSKNESFQNGGLY